MEELLRKTWQLGEMSTVEEPDSDGVLGRANVEGALFSSEDLGELNL